MTSPKGIYAGALCLVVGGTDNLNVGNKVKIVSLQGQHSTLGNIWRCANTGDTLITEYGATGDSADFAQDWLQPIPPVPVNPLEKVALA